MSIGGVVVARNTATDSANAIHTERAREYGFRGGIVPGVTLFGYLMHAVARDWGQGWLAEGELSARFRRPVYDGESLTVTAATDQGAGLTELAALNADGERCCVGQARRTGTGPPPDPGAYPAGEVPGALVPAVPEHLGTLGPLAEYTIDTSPEAVADHLAIIGDGGVYAGIVPPSLISTVSVHILGLQYEFLGPRVHARLRTRFFGTRPVGAALLARGRLVRIREHKGNHYSHLDLLVVDDTGRPVMHIDTESIFSLGAAGAKE